ncbi:MAG TPA: ABC transporter permease [Myxococcota bacterium]|nr:ABC transporter permease [Myxococcota bacterium]
MTDRSQATTTRGELSLVHASDGTLVVRLAGPWLLSSSRPSPQQVEHELARGGVTRVAFDAHELERWDSGLLAFLTDVLGQCQERKLAADPAGLPTGVQRLLALAAAVPERAGARTSKVRPAWLVRVGAATLGLFEGADEWFRFIGELTLAFGRLARFRARFPSADFAVLVQQAGAEALGIVTLVSFLVGLILAFMGAVQLLRFGATIYVADLVGLGMAREMGAVMTAVVMAGRTGAAYAAQLGTMKVTQEIDALTTFGFRPIEYLVLPRMMALCLMMPLLCLYSDLMGLLGGVVVGTGMLDLSVTQYWHETVAAVHLTDFLLGIFKAGLFGVLIALAGCLRGMQSGSSASAVGDAATQAVVTSIVLIIVTDGSLAVICNVLGI